MAKFGIPVNQISYSVIFQGDNNCYSFQIQTHNKLTTFTKSLSYSRDSVQENDTFTVMFMTQSNETSIEFKATIVGEILEEVWQVEKN